MSVIEAGTNAIQHGHKRDASKPVDVDVPRCFPTASRSTSATPARASTSAEINGDVTSPEHLFDAARPRHLHHAQRAWTRWSSSSPSRAPCATW